MDVDVLDEVEVDSTVDVDEGVVEVDGIGEGEAVVGAAEDVVGTTALEVTGLSAYLATLQQITYLG